LRLKWKESSAEQSTQQDRSRTGKEFRGLSSQMHRNPVNREFET